MPSELRACIASSSPRSRVARLMGGMWASTNSIAPCSSSMPVGRPSPSRTITPSWRIGRRRREVADGERGAVGPQRVIVGRVEHHRPITAHLVEPLGPAHTTGQKRGRVAMADDPGIVRVCLGPSPNVVDDAVERRDRGEVEFRSVDPGVQADARGRRGTPQRRPDRSSWTTSSNDVDEVAASSPIATMRSSSIASDVADAPIEGDDGPVR